MAWLLRALTRIPLPLLHATATLVYLFAFHVLRWRRAQTERDIALAFPERTRRRARGDRLRQSYRRAADTVMEALWGFGASADAIRARVSVDNPEVVERCVKEGRSVVLLTAHYANWEWLLLAAGVHFDIRIDVVYQPLRLESVDAFFREARSRFGSRLVPRKEFIFDLMTHGQAPRAYALIADQTPRRDDPKHWTRFLGRDTAFFVGAGRIARFLDAEVIHVGMRRVRRGHYAIRLTSIALPPYEDGADELVVERYAGALEAQVKADPPSFLWLQKRWKYPKPTAGRTQAGLSAYDVRTPGAARCGPRAPDPAEENDHGQEEFQRRRLSRHRSHRHQHDVMGGRGKERGGGGGQVAARPAHRRSLQARHEGRGR